MSARRWTRLAPWLALGAALACVAGSWRTRPADAQSRLVIKVATTARTGSPWTKQLRRLKAHLERLGGPRVVVKLFPDGALGSSPVLVERTRAGSLQVYAGPTAPIASHLPALATLELPLLFRDKKHVDRALDGGVLRRLKPALAKQGLVFCAWSEMGFRGLFSRTGPLHTAHELAGLRIHAPRPQHAWFRALGAEPAMLVPDAARTSTPGEPVAIQSSPLQAAAAGWAERMVHFSLPDHGYEAGMIVYSKKWLDGLPEQLRAALLQLPHSLTADLRRDVRVTSAEFLLRWAERGGTLHPLSASRRRSIEKTGRRVIRDILLRAPRSWQELVKVVRRAG